MKMKHVKLFEDFNSSTPNKVMLGFYADGGYGSHPGILTKEMYDKFEENQSMKFPNHKYFEVTEELDFVPDYLACYFDDYTGWDITGVSESQVSKVREYEIEDGINSEDPEFKMAANSLGFEDSSKNNFKMLFVLPSELNNIYWSDNPEQTHGYWEPPYELIPIEELFDDTNDKSSRYRKYQVGNPNSFSLPVDMYGNNPYVVEFGKNKEENLSKLKDRLKKMQNYYEQLSKNFIGATNPEIIKQAPLPIAHTAILDMENLIQDGDILFTTEGGNDHSMWEKKKCVVLLDKDLKIKKAIWTDGSKVSDADMSELERMMTSPFWAEFKK